MPTFHASQNAIAPGLDRKVDPIAEILVLLDGINDIVAKITGKRGRELDPLDPGRRDGTEEAGERRLPCKTLEARLDVGPITVDVLTDQMNFLDSVSTQINH